MLRTSLRPLVAIVLILLAGTVLRAEEKSPNWVKVSDKNGFTPRDSCGELVFQDKLWLMGGWVDSFKDPPRDIWTSKDGKDWTRVAETAPWKHSDFPMTLVYKDKIWVMGGWHGGRLAHASASNQVWSTPDGVNWKQETEAAAWSPRMAGGVCVFKDRMWLLGGIQKYYFGNDDDLKNDVWSSSDGVTWELATEKAPWSPRAYIVPVVLNGRIYVFAGGNYLPRYQVKNDVWSSEDGKNWRLEIEQAPWSGRIWYSAVAYRDRLWLLGGWSNNPSRNWNDVWTSKDGKTWAQFKTETVWKERHEHSTYVKDDKIYVVAGHAAPLQNDVWELFVPKEYFKE